MKIMSNLQRPKSKPLDLLLSTVYPLFGFSPLCR